MRKRQWRKGQKRKKRNNNKTCDRFSVVFCVVPNLWPGHAEGKGEGSKGVLLSRELIVLHSQGQGPGGRVDLQGAILFQDAFTNSNHVGARPIIFESELEAVGRKH